MFRHFKQASRGAMADLTGMMQGISNFSRWWEHAFLNQPFAEFDAVFIVDVEQGDGNAADSGAAEQIRADPAEMRRPFVATGAE